MRICFLGAYDPGYPRNAVLRGGLQSAGIEVVECRTGWELGAPRRWMDLSCKWRRVRNGVDAVFVPEFNHAFVRLARQLASAAGVPLLFDFFISLWDTAVNDRGMSRPNGVRGRYRRLLDESALRLPDLVIADTEAHADFYARELGARREKMRIVPIGAPEWQFGPTPVPPRQPGDPVEVLYFGNFIPHHGLEYVIEAARHLRRDSRIRFRLVGTGQEHRRLKAGYDAEPTGNVDFHDPVKQDQIPALIERADICLGTFGMQGKARRGVVNKTWQGMSAGRPVVTGDGPGSRSFFEDHSHCLLVPHGDSVALARAVMRLADDPKLASRIGAAGGELVRRRYSSLPLGGALAGVLEEAIGTRAARPAATEGARNLVAPEVPAGSPQVAP
jgi:glycosyltransferase involved in cell wall biosynthesis